MNPGRDLDILVAERVMGLKVIEFKEAFRRRYDWLDRPHNDRVVWDAPPGKYVETKISFTWRTDVKEATEYRDPLHYSTDIAAAWTIVEKLRRECILRAHEFADFEVEFLPWHAWGKTAPHAICLAALRAVEGK